MVGTHCPKCTTIGLSIQPLGALSHARVGRQHEIETAAFANCQSHNWKKNAQAIAKRNVLLVYALDTALRVSKKPSGFFVNH